jgi:hypothetical protein
MAFFQVFLESDKLKFIFFMIILVINTLRIIIIRPYNKKALNLL